HQFELGRVIPVRLIYGIVALPVFSHEQHDQNHHRNDDEQHESCCDDDEIALLHGDIAGRRHHHGITAGENWCHEGHEQKFGKTRHCGPWEETALVCGLLPWHPLRHRTFCPLASA